MNYQNHARLTLVLGPLVARCGRARVSLPRRMPPSASAPSTAHQKAWNFLAQEIKTEHDYVEATADRLKGAEIVFDKITVTGPKTC